MAGKKEPVEVVEPQTPETPEVEPQAEPIEEPTEAQPQTFTQEQQTMISAAIREAIEQSRKDDTDRYRTLQRKLNERTTEVENLKRKQGTQPSKKVLSGILDEMETLGSSRAQQLRQLADEEERKESEQAAMRIAEEYRKRVEDLGLTPKDKSYREIRSHVRNGDFELADVVLEEAEQERHQKAQVASEPENKETEDEHIERLVQERILKERKDKGLLLTDTGKPSSRGRTFQDMEAAYIRGEISVSEYEGAAKKANVRL